LSESDAQLVRNAISGDLSAFDELVSRHRSRVYHLALSKVRSRDAALDLAQDAFVQAYVSLRTLREPEKFASWLTGITSNLCLMHLRRDREIAVPDDVFDLPDFPANYPTETAMEAETARNALDELPDATRSAAILYFVEEMKLAEVAQFLGISLPAVKSRIRDARMRLQKEMIEMVKHTAKKEVPGDEFNKSLKHKLELARWYREMADYFTNGVNVISTLDVLAGQAFSEPIKEATLGLKDAVLSGRMISEAVAEFPALQTGQAIGMIRAGEVGGILDWTVRFLADWIELENGQRELELSFWCRGLGYILEAGVPVEMAFDTSLGILRTKALRDAAEDIVRSRQSGRALEEVMSQHSDALLPVVQVSLLAGERSDTLGNALQWAANAIHARMAERLFGREFQPPTPDAPWVKDFAKAVVQYAGSESPATRSAAITMLGCLGILETADTVMQALADENPEVRHAAVHAVADMEFRDGCSDLTERLHDPEAVVRRAAVEALTALEATDAAPDIARLIMDQDHRVANTAIKCLEAMDPVDVLQRWAIESISSENSNARARSAKILRDHPTPDAADVLVKALDDEVSSVSYFAALALAKLGRCEAVPMLRKMRDTHNEIGYLQWAAAEALENLGC
jgi:RNA polymerase sigma-70 factor (ECF subfamily)